MQILKYGGFTPHRVCNRVRAEHDRVLWIMPALGPESQDKRALFTLQSAPSPEERCDGRFPCVRQARGVDNRNGAHELFSAQERSA